MRSRIAAAGAVLASLLLGACGHPVPVSVGQPEPSATPGRVGSVPVDATPSAPSASGSAEPTPTIPTPTTPTPTTTSPAPTPSATTRPAASRPAGAVLAAGDRGERVRELQHRLRQLDWYAGDISGTYAASTTTGVRGFQEKRRLTTTGTVDRTTWTRLVAMTETPPTDELHNRLVAGPAILRSGDDSRAVRRVQARLRQIGWFAGNVTDHYGSATVAAVRGFQARRAIPVTGAVDRRTLDRLTAMTRTPTADDLANRVRVSTGRLDPRCLSGRVLCISKSSDTLVWVVDGTPRYRASVRFGSELTPTREGRFSVGWKSRHHVSTIYHTPMPFAMFFSGGQAVHYSADFAARGYAGASHGCVNVRDYAGIAALFDQVRVGDTVVVYR